jgi:hypothetical protein
MSEIDQILDYFEYIKQQKRSVSLHNSYYGVSVNMEITVQEVLKRRKEIQISVPSGSSMSLLPATTVEMHTDLFPRPIQARVAVVDVHHRLATLREISYIANTKDGRKEIRVQPSSELTAKAIIQGKDERTGIVADISVGGASLILKSRNLDLTQIYLPKTTVQLSFGLPISTNNKVETVDLSLSAQVTYIHAINVSGEYRVGFMTFPEEQQKVILRRYIFDYQTEIFSNAGQELEDPPPKTSIVL